MSASAGVERLGMVGVSHRQAPVQVLERLAFPGERLGQALHSWRRTGNHGVILFTCNRVELYYAGQRDPEQEALHFLSSFHDVPGPELESWLVRLDAAAAARHLFRVAAGLESMVAGESEILGQVRQAYHAALGEQCSGPLLSTLFRRAIQAGRRVRRQTGLGRQPLSLGSAAVRLLEQVRGPLRGEEVLLVGTGDVAELVGRHLRARGVRLAVASRTRGRAERLARELAGRPLGREELAAELHRVALIVAATSAHHFVIRAEMPLGGGPKLILDMAIPRNVDPRVARLPGVTLLDLDDLRGVVERHSESWERALARAEQLVEEELADFLGWLRSRRVVPAILTLRQRAEEVRRAELEKALARLPSLSAAEREVVAGLSRGIVRKLLHQPILHLKRRAAEGDGEEAVLALEEIFRLRLEEGSDGQAAPADD